MFKIILCGYKRQEDAYQRCLNSIKMQTYCDYHFIIEKEDTDANRKYLVRNTCEAIEEDRKDPDDIIVCIDADDFLIDEDAFEIIWEAYQSDPRLLLTYGSYVNYSSNKRGKFCGRYCEGESFRTSPWRGSHLKTFKYKLFNALPKNQLSWDNGELLRCCADRALMIPMMELAGYDRVKYIDMLLYCYDDTNPLSVWNTMRKESIRTREFIASRKPLTRLDTL